MVKSIHCGKNELVFKLDRRFDGKINVTAYPAALSAHEPLGSAVVDAHGDSFSVDRYAFGRDGLFLRYETDLGGVCFASHVDGEYNEEYPDPGT